MGDIITAVYRGGVLYPRQPLDLRESEEVRIRVLANKLSSRPDNAALRALIAAGRITPPVGRSSVPQMPAAKRLRLAKKLGAVPGRPLSQIIIDERGEL